MRKRLSSIVLAAAVAALAGACGTSGTIGASGSSGSSGGSAGVSTGGPSAATSGGVVGTTLAAEAVKKAADAVHSKQSAKVHMVLDMATMKETADGGIQLSPSIAMAMTMTMSSDDATMKQALAEMGGSFEIRMVDGVMYMKMGGSSAMSSVLGGKAWLKMDLSELGSMPGLSSLSSLSDVTKQEDPSQQIKSLLASPDLKKVGTEKRNGVQTTHYAGDVTVDDMLSASSELGLTQSDIDSMKQAMQAAKITKTSYDLWVDAAGLPSEVKFSEDTAAGTVGGDLVYSDWGVKVSAVAPPADQTTDFAQLMNSVG